MSASTLVRECGRRRPRRPPRASYSCEYTPRSRRSRRRSPRRRRSRRPGSNPGRRVSSFPSAESSPPGKSCHRPQIFGWKPVTAIERSKLTVYTLSGSTTTASRGLHAELSTRTGAGRPRNVRSDHLCTIPTPASPRNSPPAPARSRGGSAARATRRRPPTPPRPSRETNPSRV